MADFFPKDRVIVAVDTDDLVRATEMVDELRGRVGAFKLGLEFWMGLLASLLAKSNFPDRQAEIDWGRARRLLKAIGPDLMADFKFKDIPNTMAGAARGANALGSSLFTVHASAGMKGMAAAVENAGGSKVLAVTVLTSMGPDECQLSYGDPSIHMAIRRLARMAKVAGVHGIVCAPSDVADIRSSLDWEPEFVCPGIRPAWAETGDQNKDRAMTPAEAVRAGVSRMVIGRPITGAAKYGMTPAEAADRIAEEIASALA